MKNYLVVLFVLISSSLAFGKRADIPVVDPIKTATAKIDFERDQIDCPNGKGICGVQVFLVSKDINTDKVSWKSELYKREFKEGLETDVQEILPKSLKLRRTHVVARDERNRLYVVDLKSGVLVRPKKPIVYPADK